ncbi:glycosyltransferase family 2 protein [Bowmanella sp. Y26]|uniref:glycosyltransferase family 2 protein n=1 Tax=Bowmanella yangjiangensis TaxID=2811230 RepID=UPI001BDC9870|nr:glycosyltransferase family 2 protein [Bowmanella yangjiangensis]MBT1064914.1 glycosyltransferase family 2 protein [Bowmanella yangjiangensis]
MTIASSYPSVSRSGAKVKLVAVAKDEAPYLPEWVHHHLYFGFDEIEIYINRTSDISEQILHKISLHHPNVSFQYADWIDACHDNVRRQLQFIIYAKAFAEAKSAGRVDFIMFLDIDEMWTPNNMQKKVGDYLVDYLDADSVSFGWINEQGVNEAFQPFGSSINGQLSPLVKTAVNVRAEMVEVALHLPKTKRLENKVFGGESFLGQPTNRECLHPDLIRMREVMIVHRMFRSESEYIATLGRGRPSDYFPLKLNRGGYNKASGAHTVFALQPPAYLAYRTAYSEFIHACLLADDLQYAQQSVLARRDWVLDNLTSMPVEVLDQVLRVFEGCSDEVKRRVVESIKVSGMLETLDNKQNALTLAMRVRPLNFQLAKYIMAKAALL